MKPDARSPLGDTPLRLARARNGAGGRAHGNASSQAFASAPRLARFGPFQVLKRLGTESLFHVYKAKPVEGGAAMVLRVSKTAGPADGAGPRALVKRLAHARALKHPALQAPATAGTCGGRVFCAAAYAEGIDLARLLKVRSQLDIRLALDLAIDLADALEYAHARGVFHHAIMPSAVVLTGERLPTLLGYGVPHDTPAEARAALATGVEVPVYLAPEQAAGARGWDARTDIYSLGAVLFHALTGQPAVTGDAECDLCAQLSVDVSDPLGLRPDLPPRLARALLCMIHPDPDRRFQNATHLLVELKAIRETLPQTQAVPEIVPLTRTGTKHLPRAACSSRRLLRRAAGRSRRAAAGKRARVTGPVRTIESRRRPRALPDWRVAAGAVAIFLLLVLCFLVAAAG